MQPLLAAVLPVPVQEELLLTAASPTNKRIGSLEDLLKKHPEIRDVLIDATEQAIQKPEDKKKRKDNYLYVEDGSRVRPSNYLRGARSPFKA